MIKENLPNNGLKCSTYIAVTISLLIVILIIMFPSESVESAKQGLYTWFNIVLPSLLPFFIGSEILVGLGVVNFIGALLYPIMRPLFNVPGKGAFPLAMSITSGYPVGIKIVSKLREEGEITSSEAQRLSSFCSTSGPLFMIGAVSVGMFHNVSIGSLIALSHYLGAITVGIVFSFYKRKEKSTYIIKNYNYFKNALTELAIARKKDGRPLGSLMGDAVKEGMTTMFMVGGFIILYSVIIRILDITSLLNFMSNIITSVVPFTVSEDLIKACLSGIVEITNGCSLVASVTTTNLITKVAVVSLLIGWSGFSIHSQAMTMLSKTDIKPKLYLFAKALHGIFACLYSLILYKLIFKNIIPTSYPTTGSGKYYIFTPTWIGVLSFSSKMFLIIIITIIIISIIFGFLYKLKNKM